MRFKSSMFGETIILCVLLILDTRNIANGCDLVRPNGTNIILPGGDIFEELVAISDNAPPGLLSTFSINITSVNQEQGQQSKYLEYNNSNTELNIFISDSYKDWKRNEDESFRIPFVVLQLYCPTLMTTVEFRTQITNFTNMYDPEFPESSYEIILPMPLPAGYTIVGGCGIVIEVTDYDYHSQYKSDVKFSLKDTTGLEVTGLKSDGKKWAVILSTTSTFRIEEPLTVTLVAEDVPPEGKTDRIRTSEVNIAIVPNITASTPATPLFENPIYIFDIKQEEDIEPKEARLVEGGTAQYEAKLSYSHGENLEEFFDIDINGALITLTPMKSLASTEFSGNFGVLILEAEHPGTSRKGKTVIHVTLPGNYVTTPPSTTETTMLPCTCPTEETTHTADTTKPTEEITQCPEVTSPIELTCPDVTAPPQEKIIRFTDSQAIVYIYEQQIGYIKTMSAFCIPECKIKYEIVAGPLSNSLFIDQETAHINITENIEESGLFDVKATAEIDGIDYNKTATVHLNVLNLQPCQNGSYWIKPLTVKPVQEDLEQPYTVEKCDVNGCKCSIVKVIPEKARDYFTDDGDIVLNTIDRDDTELFPDQSNTYIILHLELSCESDEKTSYKFWDERSLSAINDIGTIEYTASRAVIVLQIKDINDNRPEFDTTSITVGYPNVEIVRQLLPPYLMKVQATDADFGENAIIKYSLKLEEHFFIHQDTGVIYPIAEDFIYEDTQFTVYADDSEGSGNPLEVNVTILTPDNLLVVRQRGSVLEDVNDVIDTISSITKYNIKLLSAAVIADDTVVKDAVHKKDDDRQLPNLKSTKESTSSFLQLIIYGLDHEEKPVSYSDIQKELGEEFSSESWAASNTSEAKPNESSDTGLLIAVIVLAAVMLLLLCGAGVAYLRYVRSRRNDENYYDRILENSDRSSITEVNENALSHAIEGKSDYANKQLSSKTEVTQPSAPLSPHLSTPKPVQELVNMTESNEFHQGTTDTKNTPNNGDGGEHQDDKNSENIVKRKKSIVTFNDNVEQIELEEV